MATGHCPQNTKPVIAVMKSDTLDKASQNFLGRRVRLQLRRTCHEVPGSVAVNISLMVANCEARLRSRAVLGCSIQISCIFRTLPDWPSL